jgi:enoyl-CoA hydratase
VLDDLEYALGEMEQDSAVKVVVITGAGEKAFVAGGDIKQMLEMDPLAAQAFSRRGQALIQRMEKLKIPVIAAVNGYALGGGLELALACDFVYASEKARLGLPEITLGVIPGFGGTQNLARLAGPNRAREMVFTGKMLSAEQAREWGIVNAVFPAEELMAGVLETARLIANHGLVALSHAKDALMNGLDMAKEDGLQYEGAMFGLLFATEDQKEGMQAFVEKRAAVFKDK